DGGAALVHADGELEIRSGAPRKFDLIPREGGNREGPENSRIGLVRGKLARFVAPRVAWSESGPAVESAGSREHEVRRADSKESHQRRAVHVQCAHATSGDHGFELVESGERAI